jgi:hypothetical protein
LCAFHAAQFALEAYVAHVLIASENYILRYDRPKNGRLHIECLWYARNIRILYIYGISWDCMADRALITKDADEDKDSSYE